MTLRRLIKNAPIEHIKAALDQVDVKYKKDATDDEVKALFIDFITDKHGDELLDRDLSVKGLPMVCVTGLWPNCTQMFICLSKGLEFCSWV